MARSLARLSELNGAQTIRLRTKIRVQVNQLKRSFLGSGYSRLTMQPIKA